MKLGEEAAEGLQVTGQDLICVAVTLMHPFGIASGVGAALTRGACLVLPQASGIKGCGNPNQRANASLRVMCLLI